MRTCSLHELLCTIAGCVLLAACATRSADPVENGQCAVPYDPLRWKAIYCMAQQGTDDLEAVQGCLGEKTFASFATVCDENLYWKKKWCAVLGDDDSKVETCVKDRSNAPFGVVHGF